MALTWPAAPWPPTGVGEAQQGIALLEVAVPSDSTHIELEENIMEERVVIGMDPHERSVTIEVMGAAEQVLHGGRFDTDVDGFAAMLRSVERWPERVWAIEGCNGIGRHIAHRLLRAGQEVVDVPPKLSARARVFATGQGRKTDATDAHSVALVGTRMTGLWPVVADDQLEVLRLLVDRRRSLSEEHTRKVSQLHRILLELLPGGAKKHLSGAQARRLLAGVRPRDLVGKTRPPTFIILVIREAASLRVLGRRLRLAGVVPDARPPG